jgi:hypothetical protein
MEGGRQLVISPFSFEHQLFAAVLMRFGMFSSSSYSGQPKYS